MQGKIQVVARKSMRLDEIMASQLLDYNSEDLENKSLASLTYK